MLQQKKGNKFNAGNKTLYITHQAYIWPDNNGCLFVIICKYLVWKCSTVLAIVKFSLNRLHF